MASKRHVRRVEEKRVCGNKAKYHTEAAARAARDRMTGRVGPSLGAYKCRFCGGYWHLGHIPLWVEQRIADRKDNWKE